MAGELAVHHTLSTPYDDVFQVEHAIKALRTSELEDLLAALERLARLAWNDDEVSTYTAMMVQNKSMYNWICWDLCVVWHY